MRISEARQNGSVLIMPLGALCPLLCPWVLVTEGNGWLKLLGSFSLLSVGILFAALTAMIPADTSVSLPAIDINIVLKK